jgi:hypothetical protein
MKLDKNDMGCEDCDRIDVLPVTPSERLAARRLKVDQQERDYAKRVKHEAWLKSAEREYLIWQLKRF